LSRRLVPLLLPATAIALAACQTDLDEPWQLDHDRIIAVRAEPPRILPGQTATIDVLLGFADAPTAERSPDLAGVVSPESLRDLVSVDGGRWIVTAPDEDRLAAARAELELATDAPVPVVIGVAVTWPTPVQSPDGRTFGAIKTVWLGDTGANPELSSVLVAGSPPDDELVVSVGAETRMFVDFDDETHIVNWLTSCGRMHDFDLRAAYLTVAPDDPQEGELALVVRDDRGGVAWRVWPIRVE
jgi:hypothetical protein